MAYNRAIESSFHSKNSFMFSGHSLWSFGSNRSHCRFPGVLQRLVGKAIPRGDCSLIVAGALNLGTGGEVPEAPSTGATFQTLHALSTISNISDDRYHLLVAVFNPINGQACKQVYIDGRLEDAASRNAAFAT